MPRPNANRLAATLLAVATLLAHAELADGYKPINVDAGRASQDQKAGRSVFEGGVRLTQGTLSLDADTAVIQEQANGEQTVKADGRPVRFKQKMEGQDLWLEARADKLEYDSKSGEVKLLGHAWLKRGEDEINGSQISYNAVNEKYQAEGGQTAAAGGDGRVKMVIQSKKKAPAGQAKP